MGLFGRNEVKKVLFEKPLAKDPLLRVSYLFTTLILNNKLKTLYNILSSI
jgi:hypothetical protein